MRSIPRPAWLISTGTALATLGSLALAAGPAGDDDPELHGAAAPAAQEQALDALQPAPRSVDMPPLGIDPSLWQALVPADNVMTDARVALGRKLYFDRRLSADGTVSCATCHDATRSFTDRRNVSEGILAQLGRRNSPTTMNAAFMTTFFWDGRAATLEDQAGQPILNPVEMGQPTKDAALRSLAGDADYPRMFQDAYGRDVNYADLERAIAAFERTLVFLDAPFDRFLAGTDSAIPDDARRGWVLFNGKGRCASCHVINRSYPVGTDNRFHNIGVAAHAQNFEDLARRALGILADDDSEQKLDELAVGTDLSELGRFMVTRNYADIGAFKTSPLRNIGVTAPYMHDGSMQTLWDTIDHYNKGGEENPFIDGAIEALDLSEPEIDQLVAFLFTLTDVRFAALNDAERERQRARAATTRPFRDVALAKRRDVGFERRVLDTKAPEVTP